MKTSIIFKLILLAFFATLYSCQNNGNSYSDPVADSSHESCRDTATAWHPTTGLRLTHQLVDSCAVNAIDSYSTFIDDSVKPLLPQPYSEKMIYGARVQRHELREVLNHLRVEDSLYIMIGLIDSIPELIFVLQSKDSSTENMYFDFTLPCPNQCPDAFPHSSVKN